MQIISLMIFFFKQRCCDGPKKVFIWTIYALIFSTFWDHRPSIKFVNSSWTKNSLPGVFLRSDFQPFFAAKPIGGHQHSLINVFPQSPHQEGIKIPGLEIWMLLIGLIMGGSLQINLPLSNHDLQKTLDDLTMKVRSNLLFGDQFTLTYFGIGI